MHLSSTVPRNNSRGGVPLKILGHPSKRKKRKGTEETKTVEEMRILETRRGVSKDPLKIGLLTDTCSGH